MNNKSKILFLLLVFLTACTARNAYDAPFAYNIDIQPGIAHVRLDYTPVTKDSTIFVYGNFFYGGMKDLMKSLINAKSSVPFRIDTSGSRIIVYHKDNHRVRITYDIIDTHTAKQRVAGEMFRPIMSKDYFFSLSHTIFLNPEIKESLKDSLMMSVTIKKKTAFPVYVTFAPELRPGETAKVRLSEGMDALVTGASNLHVEKREMAGIMNYIVLRINRQDTFNLNRFMKFFDRYLPAMNNFWGNLNGTYYSLVASPFLNIKYHKISGTAFKGGFHVKYSGDTILADNEVVYTISHEIMHRYIGAGCVSLGENNQWFDEGFTDFTTWYLTSECGIMPRESLRERVKETYEKLAVSPVRNTSNDDVMKHFWENKDYEKLPYFRGSLFAAYVSKRISESCKDTCSFRDFMRKLKSLAENKQGLLSVDDFIAVASCFIPPEEIKDSVERYILRGEMIPAKLVGLE